MMAPVARPSAMPAGNQYQKVVSALMITPMMMPMTRPTMICLRRASGLTLFSDLSDPRDPPGLSPSR